MANKTPPRESSVLTAAEKDEGRAPSEFTFDDLEKQGFHLLIDLLEDGWSAGQVASGIERGCLWVWDRYGRFIKADNSVTRHALDQLAAYRESDCDPGQRFSNEHEQYWFEWRDRWGEPPIPGGFFVDAEGMVLVEPSNPDIIRGRAQDSTGRSNKQAEESAGARGDSPPQTYAETHEERRIRIVARHKHLKENCERSPTNVVAKEFGISEGRVRQILRKAGNKPSQSKSKWPENLR